MESRSCELSGKVPIHNASFLPHKRVITVSSSGEGWGGSQVLNYVNIPDTARHLVGRPLVLVSSLAMLPRWTSPKPIRVLCDQATVTGSGTGMWFKPS